jgi:uncharacterized membrane protein
MVRRRIPAAQVSACLLAVSLFPSFACSQGQTPTQTPPAQPQQKPAPPSKTPSGQQPQQASQQPTPGPTIPSPVSRHYPILIIGHGNAPEWSLRLGMKGPERLDRPDYPPIVLEPADIASDQADPSSQSWIYKAKDSATGAVVAIRVARQTCNDNAAPPTKYTFSVDIQHAQLGTLSGCGQSAPEKFPEFRKKNQLDMPDDIDPKDKDKEKDKDKKTVLEPITKFQSPVAVAYLDATGHVVVVHGAVHKTAALSGSDLALSHDGKKLLFTYSSSKTGPERSLLLYDYDTGRTREIASNARQPFWSPDDAHIAYLKSDGVNWQLWTAQASAPETAALQSSQNLTSLAGWVNVTTVLASDLQNLYWISADRPAQSVPLKDIYGSEFQIVSSDAIRPCPINPDLLLVSAYYAKAPVGAPTDATGLNAAFFLHEVHSGRTTILGATDSYSRNAEWSRDGLQIFFTKGVPGKVALATNRIFWDGTTEKRFSAGPYMVVGK